MLYLLLWWVIPLAAIPIWLILIRVVALILGTFAAFDDSPPGDAAHLLRGPRFHHGGAR